MQEQLRTVKKQQAKGQERLVLSSGDARINSIQTFTAESRHQAKSPVAHAVALASCFLQDSLTKEGFVRQIKTLKILFRLVGSIFFRISVHLFDATPGIEPS